MTLRAPPPPPPTPLRLRGHEPFSNCFVVFDVVYTGLRDGPLEKLWGGGGEFRAAGIFFRYQIPCMSLF